MAPQALAAGSGKRAGREVLFRRPPSDGTPASKCSTPTAPSKHSAGAARVGSGGSGGACCQGRSSDWCRCFLYCPRVSMRPIGCRRRCGHLRRPPFGTCLEPLRKIPNLVVRRSKENDRFCKGLNGGGTRARTWDPMIKSYLLYQLSYAPVGRRSRKSPRKRASFSKATPGCPAKMEPVFPGFGGSRKMQKTAGFSARPPGPGRPRIATRSEPLRRTPGRLAIPVMPVAVVAAIAVRVAVPAHAALVVPPASPAAEPAVHMGQPARQAGASGRRPASCRAGRPHRGSSSWRRR